MSVEVVTLTEHVGNQVCAARRSKMMTNMHSHPTSPLAAEDRFRRALLSSSMRTLATLLADSVIVIDASGVVYDKRAILLHFALLAEQLVGLDLLEWHVEMWSDTAVVVSRVRRLVLVNGSATSKGRVVSEEVRYTRVWRLLDGAWRMAASHATVLLPPDVVEGGNPPTAPSSPLG